MDSNLPPSPSRMESLLEENRRLQEQLQLAQAAVTELETKKKFLAKMRHDVRTPLHAITGMATLALATTELNAKQRGFVESILRSANTLSELLNEILEVPKATVGEVENSPGYPTATIFEIKVLVAEDNPDLQSIAGSYLEELGCRATLVANGEEALDALAREKFDLVLMDCQMPVMDGYQATQKIRNENLGYAQIPVIALTAHASPDEKTKCLAAGMNDLVSKPIEIETLARVLAEWKTKLERRAA